MSDTDQVGQALGVAEKVMQGLDVASKFSALTGPAAPFITGADILGHVLVDTTSLVYQAHNGGKSWTDSLIEVLQHNSPNFPNSPILSGAAG